MKSAQRKVIITRSHQGNLELASRLAAMGIEALPLDLLSFLPPEDWNLVDAVLRSIRSYEWVLFTSSTGARFFAERMRFLGIGIGWKPPPRVAAVGDRTAESLRGEGVRVDFVPGRFLTEALADELPGGSGRVLLLRADIADRATKERLVERGFLVDDVPIYRTRNLQLKDLSSITDADTIIFASPSAVEAFCAQLGPRRMAVAARKVAVCIGPVTANAARKQGFVRIAEPDSHTFDSLLDLVRRTGSHA
ncbi:MAG: uroporphyrinogen-III synthase [Nitrososphaerales archaeon]|nr:uroporphyrinogen-III synthase [Nitrososphaerales archaeon]